MVGARAPRIGEPTFRRSASSARSAPTVSMCCALRASCASLSALSSAIRSATEGRLLLLPAWLLDAAAPSAEGTSEQRSDGCRSRAGSGDGGGRVGSGGDSRTPIAGRDGGVRCGGAIALRLVHVMGIGVMGTVQAGRGGDVLGGFHDCDTRCSCCTGLSSILTSASLAAPRGDVVSHGVSGAELELLRGDVERRCPRCRPAPAAVRTATAFLRTTRPVHAGMDFNATPVAAMAARARSEPGFVTSHWREGDRERSSAMYFMAVLCVCDARAQAGCDTTNVPVLTRSTGV